MGFLDTLLGRSKPVRPNLDVLFAVPSAALTLQASAGYVPTGVGSVCFKNPEGMAAEQAQREVGGLLSLDPDNTEQISLDEFGFTWVTCRRSDGDLSAKTRVDPSDWSTCTSEGPSTRSPRRRTGSVTTSWSYGCVVCSAGNFRSR